MSIIFNTPTFVPGSSPNATELNAPYNNLASTNLDGDNTDKQWATRDHLNPLQPVNNLKYFSYVGATVFTTTSTTEVLLAPGGTAIRVSPNYTSANDFVLRIQANGTVNEPLQTVFGASTSDPVDDLYQFIIKVTTNTGSSNIAYANYSFSKLAYATTAGAPAIWPDPLWYRNWNISAIKSYPAGTQIQKVEIFVKVGDAGNTLSVGYSNIMSHIMEN
jgi:hypothetical protein